MGSRRNGYALLVEDYVRLSGGAELPQDVLMAPVIRGVPEPLRSHVEVNVEQRGAFNQLRDYVVAYARSKAPWAAPQRVQIGGAAASGSAPMEVDALTHKGKGYGKGDKGGKSPKGGKDGKGKSKDGKGKNINFGNKGTKDGKAKGKEKGAAAATSGKTGAAAKFDGYCNFCWKYGHKKSECWKRASSVSAVSVSAPSATSRSPSATSAPAATGGGDGSPSGVICGLTEFVMALSSGDTSSADDQINLDQYIPINLALIHI